jgi:hypothetical protein
MLLKARLIHLAVIACLVCANVAGVMRISTGFADGGI